MYKPKKFWNILSKTYDQPEKIEDVPGFKCFDHIANNLKATDTVLDIGCARGTLASSLASKAKRVHAIDLSPRRIKIATERFVERKIESIQFSQATIYDEFFNNSSFNVLPAMSVIHLIEYIECTLQKIYQILAPGGTLISLTPFIGEKKSPRSSVKLFSKLTFLPNIKDYKTEELEQFLRKQSFFLSENLCHNNNPLDHLIVAKKTKKYNKNEF